jgi:hypothetical protein
MKKTLQEEKERFIQIVEATNMAYGFKPSENTEGRELGPLASNPFKSKEDDDAKLRSMKSRALSFKEPKWEDDPETEPKKDNFGMLSPELRHKDVYTKDELALILDALKEKVDISANYRIYDLERFLGIFKND